MKYAVSGNDMKFIDNYTIREGNVSSLILMERAAQAVCDEIIKDCINPRDVQFLLVCGKGNNGADGIAMSRMMKRNELDVRVIVAGADKLPETLDGLKDINVTEEWKHQYIEAKKTGVHFETYERGCLNECYKNTKKSATVIVDAIVGVGLKSELKGDGGLAAGEINSLKDEVVYNDKSERYSENLFVYAVDIPSGAGFEPFIKADKVVTFGNLKKEMLLYPGMKSVSTRKISNDYIDIDENIIIKNIGFLNEAYSHVELSGVVEKKDFKFLEERDEWGNKGTFGKIFIAGGSAGMCGSCCFAGEAAYRTGAGLVKILSSKENSTVYQNVIPEAVLAVYDDNNIKSVVSEQIKWSDVTILGPGLSICENSRVIVRTAMEAAKKYNKTLIIDADGLNIIADEPALKELFFERVIITPHIGEMSRLTGLSTAEIKTDIEAAGKRYALTNKINVVLKDARSVITDGNNTYINVYGNSGMAKAGSGDILTGIIAGVLSVYGKNDKLSLSCAGAMAAAIHGMAAEKAAEKMNVGSIMARDILLGITQIKLP